MEQTPGAHGSVADFMTSRDAEARKLLRERRIDELAESERVSYINENPTNAIGVANREYERELENLPARPGAVSHVINFLGSSYSGADIRVIANLYDAGVDDLDQRVQDLKKERELTDAIISGATLLRTNVAAIQLRTDSNTTYDISLARFREATGLFGNDIELQAQRFLVINVFQGANFSTFLGGAKIQRRIDNILQEQNGLLEALETKITSLEAAGSTGSTSSRTVTLATLQTISLQSFREKHGVRALGHSYVKGYTRGPRTIAGSMIFTYFDEHALAQLIRKMGGSAGGMGEVDPSISALIPDQLPPIDLVILFINEYGSISEMRLYGVEFVTDGSVFSIEDLLSENTLKFVCRDADMMTRRMNVKRDQKTRNLLPLTDSNSSGRKSASSLLFSEPEYFEYLGLLKVRRGASSR